MPTFGALVAVATAQPLGYPTATYGQRGNQMAGPGFLFGVGGGYYESFARVCRKGVISDDLQGGFQQCYCDKNHRDEDPCEDVEGSCVLGPSCVDRRLLGSGFISPAVCGQGRRLLGDELVSPAECRRTFDFYKDDLFDPDCVQKWQQPPIVRRCQSKTKSRDLAGQGACWCDSNHVKNWDNDGNCDWDGCDCRRRSLLGFCRRRSLLGGPGNDPLDNEGNIDEDWAVALHYEKVDGDNVDSFISEIDCDDEEAFEEEWDSFDPNCVERFGGYGAYGGYGGFGMGYNAGYGQQFGGNVFYPTFFAQPTAAVPVDGVAPAVATWQPQYYQSGYYGR